MCLLRSFPRYFEGPYINARGQKVLGYKELVKKLQKDFPLEELESNNLTPEQEKEFVKLYTDLQRTETIIRTFDEYRQKWEQGEIFTGRDKQNYQSHYLELHEKYKKVKKDNPFNQSYDGVEYEIETIKNADYGWYEILNLIEDLITKTKEFNEESFEKVAADFEEFLKSQYKWRENTSLVRKFIKRIWNKILNNNKPNDFVEEWQGYMQDHIEAVISEIIKNLPLKDIPQTRTYIHKCLKEGEVKSFGTEFISLIKGSIMDKGEQSKIAKAQVIAEKLNHFVKQYNGIY
ncbi:hypothetical protein NPA11_03450 [Mycoplasma sp. 1578d]|nr:hypothetical protein [Mycoplasma sp. 1578d]UUM20163.1 hypothetical protein NPA11_03450 [Mycoplasma sp. 1578d]